MRDLFALARISAVCLALLALVVLRPMCARNASGHAHAGKASSAGAPSHERRALSEPRPAG